MAEWKRVTDDAEKDLVRWGAMWPPGPSGYIIRPMYVVLVLPVGYRAVTSGQWVGLGKSVTKSDQDAARRFVEAVEALHEGHYAAVALVAITGAPDLWVPWETRLSVIGLNVAKPFTNPESYGVEVPGLQAMRDEALRVVAAELGVKLGEPDARPEGDVPADDAELRGAIEGDNQGEG